MEGILKILTNCLTFIFTVSFVFANFQIPINGGSAKVSVNQEHSTLLKVHIEMGDFELQQVNSPEGEFARLTLPGFHTSNRIGYPELPQIHNLIELPQGAEPRIEIDYESYEVVDIANYGIVNPLFPRQPSLSKSQSPADIPFEWNQNIYYMNDFIGEELITIEDKGTLRSMRIANLIVRPVNYNPHTNELKIITDLQISIHFDNADIVETERLKTKYYSPYFEANYQQIKNYQTPQLRDDLVNYPLSYLIVTNPLFEAQLADFVEWKTQKGFVVQVANTSDIGSSTSAIKSYIQNLYENPSSDFPAPSFVLFVGDVAQVPTFNGTTGSHVTDLYYVEFTGDKLPEMYHGRFSAQNSSQLQIQLDKSLMYEKFQMPDPSYLEEVLMISGVDGSFAPTHGNGQINYGTDYYFNEEHGIYSHTYLYPASDAPSAAGEIIEDYNEGVGFANYTAHCSSSGWADPSFTVSDVPGLYNDGMYNLMIGNCCTSTAFDVGESFGEAVLRKANGGAVGYIGGTNSTYWDEDYWWGVGSGSVSANPVYENMGAGVYDGLFHEYGNELEQDWFVVNDAINLAGNLAVMEGGGNDDYYWEIYHNMGDPSIMTYLGMPSEQTVNHLPVLQIGTDSFWVSASPYTHIAIAMDGVLYGSVYTGDNSDVEVPITPFTTAGTATVVVTGQNKQPYIGTVEVGNAEGPYVVVDNFSVSTSNGDENIEYGETVNVSLELKNVGNETASNIWADATVSLENGEYIDLIDASDGFGDIDPEEVVSVQNALSFTVSNSVPDDYDFSLSVLISDFGNTNMWSYNLNMTAFAPVITLDEITINDADSQADPGDVTTGRVTIQNIGGASLPGHGFSGLVDISFSSDDPYAVVSGADNFPELLPNYENAAEFNLSVSEDAPIGHNVLFTATVMGYNFETTLTGSFTIGLTTEDFETGNFANLPWNFAGDADWEITSDAYEGEYSAGSTTITHNQSSELILSANVTATDEISFYYKVSSESNYDYLRFYIDGTELDAWSGEVNWTLATYPVSSGEHTFRWAYTKDGSVDSGSDRGWIDYIIFPPVGAPAFPDIALSAEEVSIQLEADSAGDSQFTISNNGDGELQYSISAVIDDPELAGVEHEIMKLEKGERDPRPGMSPSRDYGGPDAFGYQWIDSNEPGGPEYTWTEINFCGNLIGEGDDSNEGPFEIGFPFYFYGNEYSAVRVCSNGFLSLTSTATAYDNEAIPSSTDPNALLAPFWDDLNPNDGGQMYYYQWGDQFIVEWDAIPHYGSGNPETFQVILNSDGSILFNYKIVADGSSATVGIENENGTDGLQVVFNSSYLSSEKSILFGSNFLQPWMQVMPISGIVAPGEDALITVVFNSEELAEGMYTGSLNITSNDPEDYLLTLPVSMEVGEGGDCGEAGDVNGDGDANIQDIILVVNCILYDACNNCSDLNSDNDINIQDIITLVNIILN